MLAESWSNQSKSCPLYPISVMLIFRLITTVEGKKQKPSVYLPDFRVLERNFLLDRPTITIREKD